MSIVVWDLTYKCNLNCKHCYNHNKYFNNNINDISDIDAIKLIKFFKDNKVDKIHFLGGEPMLRTNFFDIVKLCKESNINVSFTTNGTLFTDSTLNKIVDLDIDTIFISLDGYDTITNDFIRGEGTFKKVICNIDKLKKYKFQKNSNLKIILSVVINKINYKNFYKFVDLCKEHNITDITISTLMENGEAKSNIDELDEDIFNVLDSIENFVIYSNKTYNKLKIQIDVRPLVHFYYFLKYGYQNVVYSLNHTKCDVLNGMMYLTADGFVHPCGLYEMNAGIKYQKLNYFNSKDSKNIKEFYSLDEIMNSKYFLEFKSGLEKLKKDSYCYYCKFCPMKSDCFPCPYQFSRYNVDVKECIWAGKKIIDYTESFMNSTIVYNEFTIFKYFKYFSSREKHLIKNLKNGISIRENYNDNFNDISVMEYCSLIKECSKKNIIELKGENYES